MLDFVKIHIPAHYCAALLSHPELSFQRDIDEDTGEINSEKPRSADYRSMKFTIHRNGYCILSGSLHKMYHEGKNYKDFTFHQFIECVQTLHQLFNLNPSELKLLQLEVGVNIQTQIDPKQIIQLTHCDWNGNRFGAMPSKNIRSFGVILERTEYAYKLYNKGKQYQLTNHLLRFELKITKGRNLRRNGFHTLFDLCSLAIWDSLSKMLNKAFEALVITEPSLDVKSLSQCKREFVYRTATAEFWGGLSANQRMKCRKRLSKIIELNGTANLKIEIQQLIQTKTEFLIEGHKIQNSTPKKDYVFPAQIITSNNEKGLCFSPSNNVGSREPEELNKRPAPARRCKSCGRDISDQRIDSIYCSEKRYGSKGKKCRNKQSNPIHNRLRHIRKLANQLLLFEPLEMIVLTELERQIFGH